MLGSGYSSWTLPAACVIFPLLVSGARAEDGGDSFILFWLFGLSIVQAVTILFLVIRCLFARFRGRHAAMANGNILMAPTLGDVALEPDEKLVDDVHRRAISAMAVKRLAVSPPSPGSDTPNMPAGRYRAIRNVGPFRETLDYSLKFSTDGTVSGVMMAGKAKFYIQGRYCHKSQQYLWSETNFQPVEPDVYFEKIQKISEAGYCGKERLVELALRVQGKALIGEYRRSFGDRGGIKLKPAPAAEHSSFFDPNTPTSSNGSQVERISIVVPDALDDSETESPNFVHVPYGQ